MKKVPSSVLGQYCSKCEANIPSKEWDKHKKFVHEGIKPVTKKPVSNSATEKIPKMVSCRVCGGKFKYETLSRHVMRQHTDSNGKVHGIKRNYVWGVGRFKYPG